MSRYLYNAAYYWELVVDSRNPEAGHHVYLEERSTGRRHFLQSVPGRRELETLARQVQRDLYLAEEEFEARYGVSLSSHADPEPSTRDGLPQTA